MARRATVVLTVALAVLVVMLSGAVSVLVIRSIDQGHGLEQRPNCALVDDAIRTGRVPNARVQALCRSSARGLIYSLTPEDFRAIRRRGR